MEIFKAYALALLGALVFIVLVLGVQALTAAAEAGTAEAGLFSFLSEAGDNGVRATVDAAYAHGVNEGVAALCQEMGGEWHHTGGYVICPAN